MKIKADKMCKLEKLGFVITYNHLERYYYKDIMSHLPDDRIYVSVDIDTRTVEIHYQLKHGGKSFTLNLKPFYDLIKADMVEVEDVKD